MGATVDCYNKYGHTPLHIALRAQRHDLVEILLSYGANPSLSLGNGQPLLHLAVEMENDQACKLLLKSSHAWKVEQDGNSPLHLAARHRTAQIMTILVKVFYQKELLNQINNYGDAALHVAAFHSNLHTLTALLQAGADPEARQRDGSHIIHSAIRGVC